MQRYGGRHGHEAVYCTRHWDVVAHAVVHMYLDGLVLESVAAAHHGDTLEQFIGVADPALHGIHVAAVGGKRQQVWGPERHLGVVQLHAGQHDGGVHLHDLGPRCLFNDPALCVGAAVEEFGYAAPYCRHVLIVISG